jgi:adenosine deaminase
MGAVKGSGYTKKDLLRLMMNAFEGSWLPQNSKDQYIKTLKDYAMNKE